MLWKMMMMIIFLDCLFCLGKPVSRFCGDAKTSSSSPLSLLRFPCDLRENNNFKNEAYHDLQYQEHEDVNSRLNNASKELEICSWTMM